MLLNKQLAKRRCSYFSDSLTNFFYILNGQQFKTCCQKPAN